MDDRVEKATDKTQKPGTEDEEVSIGSMGFQTDAENAESDTFVGNYEEMITDDKASLFILCKFGPDARGGYTESILSMFDYKMLCTNQKTDFCTCRQRSLCLPSSLDVDDTKVSCVMCKNLDKSFQHSTAEAKPS